MQLLQLLQLVVRHQHLTLLGRPRGCPCDRQALVQPLALLPRQPTASHARQPTASEQYELMQPLALQLRPTCVLVQLASSAGVLLLLLAIMAFLVPERLASAGSLSRSRALLAQDSGH